MCRYHCASWYLVPWGYHGVSLSWSSLSQIHTIDTPRLACEGEVWGVNCEFKESDLFPATVVLYWIAVLWHLDPVSVSNGSSCRGISWSLEAARFKFKIVRLLWDLAGTAAALLLMCPSDLGAIRAFLTTDLAPSWLCGVFLWGVLLDIGTGPWLR